MNAEVLPLCRLARVQRDVSDYSVSFVEDAEHRNALRHWRNARLTRTSRGRAALGSCILLPALLPAAGETQGEQQKRCGGLQHAYSGIHGS
jgi:hypothetical protein